MNQIFSELRASKRRALEQIIEEAKPSENQGDDEEE